MSGDPSRVRIADERDEEALFELCQFLHGENGIFTMSEPAVRAVLRKAIIGPVEMRRGIVGVIGERNDLHGAIFLEIGSQWYSDDISLAELFNYVYPQHRKTSASNDLIAFAKKMSDHFGVPLMIGVLSNTRTEAKVRLYRKQLGEPVGAFFLHGATTGRGVH